MYSLAGRHAAERLAEEHTADGCVRLTLRLEAAQQKAFREELANATSGGAVFEEERGSR